MPSVIEKPVAQSSGDRYREAADLIAAYGHAMDDGEIDLWPQFFVPNGFVSHHDQGKSRGCPAYRYHAVCRSWNDD